MGVLSQMEAIRKAARKKEDAPNNIEKNKKASRGLFANPDFDSLASHLKDRHPNDAIAQNLISQVQKEVGQQFADIKKVVARYHGLVTLGQLMDMLLHQSRQPLSKIVNEAFLGREDIEEIDFKSNKLLTTIHSRLTKIEAQGGVLHGVIKRVEPFGGRKRGRPAQLYLEKVLHDSFDIFTEQLKKLKVSVFISDSKTLATIDPAELQEVIVNLIQNSLYWIQNVDKDIRKISVAVERTSEGYVEIVFADSGPGIPPENREQIFEPYFSTRKDGIGIGLSISGDIIGEYYGGSLELLEDHPLGGAAFVITLKKRV
jgi:signal transduction histidine kinase